MDKKGKIIRLACIAAAVSAAVTAGAVSSYMLWEKPPEQAEGARALTEMLTPSPGRETRPSASPAADKGQAFETDRRDGVYTLLLVGNDDGTGNTDTIMLGKLDTVRHTADFVSIPRDTLINVDSPVRKINSVYWGSRNNGGDGISSLSEHVRKLSGIDPDCYAVIDLDVFVEAVDQIGGIWFDVPERMYYEEGPVIDLQPGYQLLNGLPLVHPVSSKRYPSRLKSRAGFFASTRDGCLSPRVRLECNPEIPFAPGEEHWLLDTSLDEVYWPCSHSRAVSSFSSKLEWKIGLPWEKLLIYIC